jgi:hypothetical protein
MLDQQRALVRNVPTKPNFKLQTFRQLRLLLDQTWMLPKAQAYQ